MGLPGETYETWVDGLGSLLSSNVNNQIFVYLAFAVEKEVFRCERPQIFL